MKIVLFYHSLLSDWNHGNAHFLRGVVSDLLARGHDVAVYEPHDAWSLKNLLEQHGEKPVEDFRRVYPGLSSIRYDLARLDLDEVLSGAEIVIVHEWNDHQLVRRVGEHRARYDTYRLFFHDTHHRMVTAPESMAAYELSHYDGVLAYGDVLRELYENSGRVRQAWTWHEAADVRVFSPHPEVAKCGDLVWVGNWGDDERTTELDEFLIQPCAALKLSARVHGVRYPAAAVQRLTAAGIEYSGWLPNFAAPGVFAQHRVTVHIPRRPYVQALPGIPTIRVFEALACGIPLICSPWNDVEGLFEPGKDFLVARNGAEMSAQLRAVLNEPEFGRELAQHGLQTVHEHHTCAHRVDELLSIHAALKERATGVIASASL
ncbi:MAG TPA: glycosyltransferase [Verrucomicrobiae bacterium]|nr:glycosyltransferase [Verrucomicrobiae bacterium]